MPTTSPHDYLAVLGLLQLVASFIVASHALLHKRNPRSALGWVALILFAPVVGMIAYWLLGINRIRRRAQKIRRGAAISPSKQVQLPEDIQALRRAFTTGNTIESYMEGGAIFSAAGEAIRTARDHIYLSVYIFESRGVGSRLISELGDAVERGVEVKVLLDGVGALYSFGSTRRKLAKIGVDVASFLPPRSLPPMLYLNIRNHRKILVIDNDTAFVGGTNVRNAYLPASDGEGAGIRDTLFKLRGPIVEDIRTVFVDDWLATTGHELPPRSYNSVLPVTDVPMAACRVVIDGPDNDVDILSMAYQAAIGRAERSVVIMTPYFLPPEEVIAALQLAAIRGVRVDVILPAANNIPLVHWATQNMLWQLVRYGINVSYQHGSFNHSKILVIDDDYCLIGSANVDSRSLRLNFEIGIEVQSGELVKDLQRYIELCLASSNRITHKSLSDVSVFIRIRNALAWLITPYL